MKKQILYLASAALVAGLAACSNDELGESSSLNLKKGELSATIQDAVSTRTSIDGKYKLSWVKGDAIGAYSTLSDNLENYKYNLEPETVDETEVITGKFVAAKDQEIPEDYTPAVAYYPYYDNANAKITTQGRLAMELPSEIDYAAGKVEAPMVGDVVNSNISFQAVTALLKIRVENVPTAENNPFTKAVLTTTGKKAIAGKAYVDLNTRILEVSDDSKTQMVTISFTNSAVASYDFYYIIPEGDYDLLTVTLTDGNTNTKTLISEKSLSAKANHIYTKTLRFDGDDLEDGVIAQLNDDLITVADGGSVTADFSKFTTEPSSATIIIPTVASTATPKDEITINLQNLDDTPITIQPDNATGLTPKKVIIKTGNNEEADDVDLTINLPKSYVELAPLTATGKVTLAAVEFSTLPNVLRIEKGVTVSELTRTASSGTGNVYVAAGASATIVDGDFYIFQEKDATVAESEGETSFSSAELVGDEMYTLLYPTKDAKPTLSQDYELKAPIEIGVAGVQLNLAGYELKAKSGSNAIVVKDGGSLTIVDNPAADVKTTGKVTGQGAAAAISVEKGGEVTVSAGEISHNADDAVKVVGGTFNLNGGTISASTSGKYAISLSNGATATINSASVINAATANHAVAGDIKAEKSSDQGATASTLNLKQGTVSGVLTLTASNLNVNGGTLAGASSSDATVTATEGAAITVESGEISASTKSAISLNASSLTVNGGTITESNAAATSAIVDAEASTIAINDGTISSTAGAALDIQKGSTATVKGGTITAKTSAVNIKKGTLLVTGTGKPAFKGSYAISSTDSAADEDAKVTLEAADATYVGKSYVIYNHKNPSNDAASMSLLITGGWFTGDIYTDYTKYFIKGGHFTDCDVTLKGADAAKYIGSGYALTSGTDENGYYEAYKVK